MGTGWSNIGNIKADIQVNSLIINLWCSTLDLYQGLAASGHPSWILHAPPQPIPYGTTHTKLFLVHCAAGIRVIVLTANLTSCHLHNKTQGIWWQDFPAKVSLPDRLA